MAGTFVRGCMCAASWSDLDWTFDLAVVALTYKILSGLYLRNRKMWKLQGYWLGGVGVRHGLTLI